MHTYRLQGKNKKQELILKSPTGDLQSFGLTPAAAYLEFMADKGLLQNWET